MDFNKITKNKNFAIIFLVISLSGCLRQSDESNKNTLNENYKSIFQHENEIKKPIVAKKSNLSSENKFIRKYMEKVYGTYRSEADCWMLPKSPDVDIRFCMEIKRVDDAQINGVAYKFVEANGLYVNEKNLIDPDGAPHVAPGISGLFVFQRQNKGWALVSKIEEFESETWGRSGIDEKSFTQFGPEVYGWQISDGGMWQGQIYESVFYIALTDNHLKKILDFPLSFNADGYGNKELIEQNYESEILVNQSKIVNGLYVLYLQYSSNKIKKKYSISFNKKDNEYLYPIELYRIKCSDIVYGSPKHIEMMERLHSIVGLPGDYFNKYHEHVVQSVCKKDDKNIQLALDSSWINPKNLYLIKSILILDLT